MMLLQEFISLDSFQLGSTSNLEFLNKLSLKFFLRLFIDLFSVVVLVRLIYYRTYKKSEHFFTFFTFNITIFLITNLLNHVEMSMGAAFGLFAVFSMLRYRTESISTRDMTYLFLVIAIGLLSAVSKGEWYELLALNAVIWFSTALLESNWLVKKEYAKSIIFEQIELIHEDKRMELLKELKSRTGLNVHRVEIQSIDFLKDATRMIIYYFD